MPQDPSVPPRRLPESTAFVVATVAFVLIFASAGAPIPLYETFRVEDGLDAGQLALGAVAYFAGTLLSLLVCGRLSDAIGRKPVVLAALVFAMAGSLVMSQVHGFGLLALARLLQGTASGLAASALGAYVFDNATRLRSWIPAMVTGSGATLGIPVGALLSGLLAETAPAPRVLVFVVIVLALLACAIVLSFGPETSPRTGRALASLRPRLWAPAGSARLIIAVGAALFGTWSIGGYYQSYAPTITADELGSESPLVAAAVFASIMVAGPLGGPIAGRLGPRRTVRYGMIVFVLALVGALLSLANGRIVPFVVCSAVSAVMLGAIGSGGNRALLSRTDPGRRGAMLSTLYVISYAGAGIPAFASGALANTWGLIGVYAGYVVVIAAMAAIAWFVYPRERT